MADWSLQVIETSNAAIPKTSKRVFPHIKPNNRINSLQTEHTQLMQIIQLLSPSHESQIQLQNLRSQIKDEFDILQNEQ